MKLVPDAVHGLGVADALRKVARSAVYERVVILPGVLGRYTVVTGLPRQETGAEPFEVAEFRGGVDGLHEFVARFRQTADRLILGDVGAGVCFQTEPGPDDTVRVVSHVW